MADNKKKNNEEEVYYVETAGIQVGHRKIPRFLVLSFIVVSVWAVIYGVYYDGAVKEERTVEKTPQEIVNTSCTACHGSIAPKMEVIAKNFDENHIKQTLQNGGAQFGKPGMPAFGSDAEIGPKIDDIAKYVDSLDQ